MFLDRICRENQNTHFAFNNFPPPLSPLRKLCCFLDNAQKYWYTRTGQRRQHGASAISCWIPKATNTLRICNTYINNSSTRCNTKQSVYYSAGSLYMFRVSTAPISMHHASTSLQRGQAWPRWREVDAQHSMASTKGCSYSFVYS